MNSLNKKCCNVVIGCFTICQMYTSQFIKKYLILELKKKKSKFVSMIHYLADPIPIARYVSSYKLVFIVDLFSEFFLTPNAVVSTQFSKPSWVDLEMLMASTGYELVTTSTQSQRLCHYTTSSDIFAHYLLT